MIISDEQVQRALRYLHRTEGCGASEGVCAPFEPSNDLLDRISEELDTLPETRMERVAAAREDLASGGPSAEDVASKIIGRAISDSIR